MLYGAGCVAAPPRPPEPASAPAPAEPSPDVYRRADQTRLKALELEVERLNSDIRTAEETLLAVESGLRGTRTRTEAVSMLAEARIQVDRAAKRVPWRTSATNEAREKLEEADRQIAAGHDASAIFFASRASRIAAALLDEAERVAKTPGTRIVKAQRANLRAAPSTEAEVVGVVPAKMPVFPELEEGEWLLVRTLAGQVGWVHQSLVRAR